MFAYPLKKREIYIFLQHEADYKTFEAALEYLQQESALYCLNDFYCLHHDIALVEKRIAGNKRAEALLKKAAAGARLLSRFPYVRGVAISGSLSKNYADESADVDYFIITKQNRLWIARSFLHIFKKITFLFHKEHMYCMNYFVDETATEITEKNIYTATEIATVLPVYGIEAFKQFYRSNSWIRTFLPNHYLRVASAKNTRSAFISRITEKILNNRLGDVIDTLLRKWTVRNWEAKTRKKKKNNRGILLELHTSIHHAKPNPENFQHKLLQHYENKLAGIFDNCENILSPTAGI